jgi:V8-like Glu-specific endopeptidase
MNKIKILLSAILLLNISPAHAMENAKDAIGDTRTLPLIIQHPLATSLMKGCTGFLYSERIVLTAGHCIFERDTKSIYPKIYVGLPGVTYSKENVKLLEVEKTILPTGFAIKGPNDFSDIEDFGILILKEPIKIIGKTTIATQEQIDLYIKNKTLVSTVGYGRQSVSHKQNDLTVPQYAEFPLESLDIVKTVLNSNKYYGMKINTVQIPGGPSTCAGDSGSAFYIKNGENFIYLGPLSWGVGMSPNCSGNGWQSRVMYIGSVAAYDYLYLIKEAEDYVVKQNTIITPAPTASPATKKPIIKITIKCYKGKEVKKIYGINPKCPKGYKVKV